MDVRISRYLETIILILLQQSFAYHNLFDLTMHKNHISI